MNDNNNATVGKEYVFTLICDLFRIMDGNSIMDITIPTGDGIMTTVDGFQDRELITNKNRGGGNMTIRITDDDDYSLAFVFRHIPIRDWDINNHSMEFGFGCYYNRCSIDSVYGKFGDEEYDNYSRAFNIMAIHLGKVLDKIKDDLLFAAKGIEIGDVLDRF